MGYDVSCLVSAINVSIVRGQAAWQNSLNCLHLVVGQQADVQIVILCHFLFQILNPTCISSAFPLSSISDLECQDVKCTLSDSTIALTLRWVATNNRVDPIEHCNIYCSSMIGNHQDKETTWKSDYVFIGRAYASCFRVTNLYMLSPNLEESPFSIEFRVQPVSCSRRKPRVEESECLLVEVNPWFSLLSVLFELYLAIFISAMKRISNIKYIHLEASWNSMAHSRDILSRSVQHNSLCHNFCW